MKRDGECKLALADAGKAGFHVGSFFTQRLGEAMAKHKFEAFSLREHIEDDLSLDWDEFVEFNADTYEDFFYQDGDVQYYLLFSTTAYSMVYNFLIVKGIDLESRTKIMNSFPKNEMWFL